MNAQGGDIRAEAPTVPETLEALAAALDASAEPDRDALAASAFGRLGAMFTLTEAETAAMAMLAGAALSDGFARALEKRGAGMHPTAGGLRAVLPDLGWDSFAPGAVLRSWSLMRLHQAGALREARVTIDPRILDWCLGIDGPDARLLPYLRPLARADRLAAPHAARIDGAATALAAGAARHGRALCVIVGDGAGTRGRIAANIAEALEMTPLALAGAALDPAAGDRALLLRLIARETVLSRRLPVIALAGLGAAEAEALACLEGPALALAPETEHRVALPPDADLVALTPPDAETRAALWLDHLGPGAGAEAADLAEAFAIGADDIAQICRGLDARPAQDRARAARAAARRLLAPPPDPLIQDIIPRVGWADIVLPAAAEANLRAIAAQARNSAKVYRDWRFGARASRGLGITALFCGPSGAGKTLAAEVIADDLGRRLLRVNLAQVVDKYVGETEKHLDHVFAIAERSGAILLFDEAEALFRQRGDGDGGQEKFTSMTVAYLLQRIESCAAICLLTTNMRSAIDEAFMRRLRFVVQFAFPGAAERLRLWARVFPDAAPVGDIDLPLLAALPATGGVIRNAALNAAFLAAEDGRAIGMDHVVAALDLENAKLPQPIDLGPLRRRAAR